MNIEKRQVQLWCIILLFLLTSLICTVYFGVQALYDVFFRNGLPHLKSCMNIGGLKLWKYWKKNPRSWSKLLQGSKIIKLIEICVNTEISDVVTAAEKMCILLQMTVLVLAPSLKFMYNQKSTVHSRFMPSLFLCGYRNILSEDIDKLLQT